MPRLLVGLRHAVLAIELQRQGFEVVDLRDLEAGLGSADPVDVVVADVAAMADRTGARGQLLARARSVPLVVLAAPGEWELVRGPDLPPDVLVVGSPVSAADLAASIRSRLPAPAAELAVDDVVPEGEQAGADPAGPGPSTVPAPRARARRGADTATKDPIAAAPASGADEAAPPDAGPLLPASLDVVRARAEALTGLEPVAGHAVGELAAACHADVLALLVPAVLEHVVLAGCGLRPLESRLTVPVDSWLARQLEQVGPVLLVDDTDRHRAELACTPAARRRRLLAVRWSEPDLLVLAGRDAPAFARADVVAVLAALPAVAGPLVEALALRELARALAPFA